MQHMGFKAFIYTMTIVFLVWQFPVKFENNDWLLGGLTIVAMACFVADQVIDYRKERAEKEEYARWH
jgi:uncharacterized membrane protein